MGQWRRGRMVKSFAICVRVAFLVGTELMNNLFPQIYRARPKNMKLRRGRERHNCGVKREMPASKIAQQQICKLKRKQSWPAASSFQSLRPLNSRSSRAFRSHLLSRFRQLQNFDFANVMQKQRWETTRFECVEWTRMEVSRDRNGACRVLPFHSLVGDAAMRCYAMQYNELGLGLFISATHMMMHV